MKDQPYIYTLPEQFIQDKSVPLHWKLYTLINGFWIAGKPVFAGNEYFALKLGCSERHIQRCLKRLEEICVLDRQGISQNRKILPMGATSEVVGGRPTRSQGDEPAGRHSSDSSSDSINTSVASLRIESDTPKKEKTKTDQKYLEVFRLWGDYPRNWVKNTTQRFAAENLLAETDLEQMKKALALYEKYKGYPFCPQIRSPWDLDTKWDSLLDFKPKHV